MQATARVGHCSLCHLGLEPYSQAIFKQGLKVRKVGGDREESKVLDRAMEYARIVGVELVDMLVSINSKVKALAPQVLAQHTFGGDGLWNFICDYQDCLEYLEGSFGNLTMMVENAVGRIVMMMESYRWDLCQVERLNSELLVQVMVLEVTWDHLIVILDSPLPIPIPAPGGDLLVEINNGVDDAVVQAIIRQREW